MDRSAPQRTLNQVPDTANNRYRRTEFSIYFGYEHDKTFVPIGSHPGIFRLGPEFSVFFRFRFVRGHANDLGIG